MQWCDESTKCDVVNSKFVVPPEDVDILEVKAEMVCRVACDGGYHKAKVLEVG